MGWLIIGVLLYLISLVLILMFFKGCKEGEE